MPGVLARRTRTPRGKLSSSSKLPASTIDSFASASKLQIGKESSKKASDAAGRTSSTEIVLTSRKRKVETDVEPTSKKPCHIPGALRAEPATPVSGKKKRVTFADSENVPLTPSRVAPTPSCNRKRQFEADDTTQAEVLLERLNLQSPVCKRTKTTVDRRSPKNDFDLPLELLDLLDLHAAFLKTLSMQYAHLGTNSPIDLRTIFSSVTRTWGKRQVTLDDIQRLVGVLSWTPVKSDRAQQQQLNSPFFLSDYGRGKICVEFHPNAESGPLREHKLNMDFEANLRTLWLSRREQPSASTTLFIATLPKAAVKPCPSLAKSSRVLKNQQTIDELKTSIALKRQEKGTPKASPPATNTTNAVNTTNNAPPSDGPKLSVLDRIRLKSQSQTAGTGGPTPAELQRRAALQRAADVAAVIGMLCKATAAQARMAFTMAALQVRLRDSSRTPVSHEDGAACVRLLAAEVAPQWLRVVTVAGKENVVVQPAFQPSKAEVEEKVKVLLGE